MELLMFFIISLTFFFIGRYSVSDIDTRKIQETIKKAKKIELGIVKRPTQDQLEERTPRGKKLKETEDAIAKTLDELISDEQI